MRLRVSLWTLFGLLPVLVAVILGTTEYLIMGRESVDEALGETIPDTISKVIELNSDLAKLFISLSTAILGGVAYYLQASKERFPELTRLARFAIVACLTSTTLSIFFGHLWMVGMRNQLANDVFNAQKFEILWPERLQYFSFLLSLSWFALFVMERERVLPAHSPP